MSNLITINDYATRFNISKDKVRFRLEKARAADESIRPAEVRHASTGGNLWNVSVLDSIMNRIAEKKASSTDKTTHQTTKLVPANKSSMPADNKKSKKDTPQSDGEKISVVLSVLRNAKDINEDTFKFVVKKLVQV